MTLSVIDARYDIAMRLARLPDDKRKGFLQALKSQGVDMSHLPIVRAPAEGNKPVSYAQMRQWFMWRLDPASTAYHIPGALRLKGLLDVAALRASFDALTARHESLRTVFRASGEGLAEQVVLPGVSLDIAVTDLSEVPAGERPARVLAQARRVSQTPFDLGTGPLLRVALIRLAPQEHVLVVVMHHIISDAWSMQIIVNEFVAQYRAIAAGAVVEAQSLPIQYADYAAWQRNWLEAGEKDRQLAYWRDRLGGAQPVLQLPTDHPRRADGRFRAATHGVDLPEALAKGLQQRSQSQGATLFMSLLAGFQVLLSRYTGQEDIRVGVPIANRHRPETQGLVGFFVNTQVLRNVLDSRATLSQVLAQAREAALGAQDHQDLPFEQLVEALQPERSLSTSPLFQVMFNHARGEAGALAQLPGLSFEGYDLGEQEAQFEMTLDIHEASSGQVRATFTYPAELFDKASIVRMGGHYLAVLQAMVHQPDALVGAVALLDDEERQQLEQWGVDGTRHPDELPVHRLFERQARACPQATALIFDGEALSYDALNQRANRLAHRLRALGVGSDRKVGIAVERSTDMIIGLLAILKAGGAYVPLDPQYPRERLSYMVQDSRIGWLLTQQAVRAGLPDTQALATLELDTLDLSDEPSTDLPLDVHGHNLAYVIYTSGSTGKPKGVEMSHRALAQHTQESIRFFGLTPPDRMLQFATLNFDGFIEQTFPPLAAGAAIVLRGPSLWDSDTFYRHLIDQEISVADLTTAYWLLLVQDFAARGPRSYGALRQVHAGGEAMPPEGLKAWNDAGLSHVRLLNTYGPTEATVTASVLDCAPYVQGTSPLPAQMPIGRPLAGRALRVLDAALNLVPVGVPGELCIGGDLLARGYGARAGLSAERFVADPFGAHGRRLYRTGDLVRWRGDGELEYLGRIDHQIKIRGFRVEMGEIEAQLLAQPEVREAVVVARESTSGLRLVAYVSLQPAQTCDPLDLRGRVGQALPDYMVPAVVMVLDQLPLNPNGKVDRHALPEPQAVHAPAREMPQGELESVIAQVWGEVLGVEGIGRHDNFFELGGDSLLSLKVVAKARRHGIELSPRQLFEHQTPAALVAAVQRGLTHGQPDALVIPAMTAAERAGRLPLSHAQMRQWFMWQLDPSSTAYHVSSALELKGVLDVPALKASFDALIQRHESLRTVFQPDADGLVEQVVQPPWPLVLEQVDLASGDPVERDERARTEAGRLSAQPFDLTAGPLLRVGLLRLAADRHVLLVVMHHIISDEWSTRIMVREFVEQYQARTQHGHEPAWQALPIQYADYALWQRRWLDAGEQDRQLAYWTGQLAGQQPVLQLHADRARRPDGRYRAARHRVELSPDLATALQQRVRSSGATLFMALLTGFQVLLNRCTGQTDLRVGVPFANRHRPETEGLLGYFINTLVLRNQLHGGMSLAQVLAQTREASLGAQEHQDLPLELLVEALQPDRQQVSSPLFQVVFNHIGGQAGAVPRLDGIEARDFPLNAQDAKLDLTLITSEDPDGRVHLNFDYASELFDARTIERMAAHYLAVLQALAVQPWQTVDEVALLQPGERQTLLQWGVPLDASADGAAQVLVPELIERQTRGGQEASAVVCEGLSLTHAQLHQRADRLAHRLAALGVRPETRVGVAVGRSIDMVVALLAVLRAGGVFVPLDPALPAERLAYQVQDSGAALVLAADALAWDPGVPVLGLASPAEDAPTEAFRRVALSPDQAAYVIYTSGSTGRPKGVVVSHGALASYVRSVTARMGLDHGVRSMAMVSTVAADLGHTVLFGALCTGRTLHLISAERSFEPERFAAYVREHRVDVLKITPSHLQALLSVERPADVLPVRLLILGGEPTTWALLDRIASLRPDLRVMNHYGPTETTVGMLTQDAGLADRGAATLAMGRPLDHGAAYVLDARLELMPRGVPGELYLGGKGLARGYMARPDLSADRFVASPFDARGSRLYRTGDLVRWTSDGQLEYLGRIDQQVKVRGFRIELGEIEARLLAQPEVEKAAVVARESDHGTRLLAYVAARTGQRIDSADLLERLGRVLPDYMVPSALMVLDAMPLTANGKLDSRALPEPEMSSAQTFEPPQGEVELALAHIWMEVLKLPQVGRDDRFFQLGGDSIVSVRVVSRLRRAGWVLTVRQLFEHQTLRALGAIAVPVADKAAAPRVQEIRRGTLSDHLDAALVAALPFDAQALEDVYPLTSTQEGMFFHSTEAPGSGLYVNQLSIEVRELDPERLDRAWQALVARHAVLRTGVLWQTGMKRPIQLVFKQAPCAITHLDWRGTDGLQARVGEYVRQDLVRDIDWLRPPLARVSLIRLDDVRHQMVWTNHHILFDGWSASRLMGEWLRLYAGEQLPPGVPVYGDYVRWLHEQGAAEAEAFWKTELSELDGPTLLAESVRGKPGRDGFIKIYTQFDAPLTDRFKAFAQREGVTLNTVVQAAWALLLQRHTGRDNVVFGATVAGRPAAVPGAEDMIGLFINTIPVPVARRSDQAVGDHLRELQDRALRLRDHEHTALADIQRWTGWSGRPLFDSIIVFENAPIDDAMRSMDGYGLQFGALASEGLTGYAMDLQVVANDTLSIEYCYAAAAFDDDHVQDLRVQMEHLLHQMMDDAGRPVGELSWLDMPAQARLFQASGSIPSHQRLQAPVDERIVHRLIERQALHHGDAVALLQGEGELTYAQLNARANRLAHHLIGRGVGPETRVAVVLERSLDSVVTLLAILKAGAAYVPLDPAYPADRLLYMVTDSGASLLLVHRSVVNRLPAPMPVQAVVLEDIDLLSCSGENPSVALHPDSMAYVIYTSGSTGMPKGVSVTHGPLAMHCLATAEIYEMGPRSRELHFMSFSFDGAHERWLTPLCIGASLALRDDELWTAEQACEALHRYGVSNAAFPPAYLEQVADWAGAQGDAPPVELYVFGGEAMPKAAYDKVREHLRPRLLINGYGPTETVVTPLIWKTPASRTFDSAYAPIGRPVGERTIHVLDADMQVVAPGVCGELYIGGYGLARGYLGRPGMSADRFVADPFDGLGGRLYRTGDLVRWSADGQMQYIGRVDHQVKIRGFRIELGEIEARLREVDGVLEAAVVARDGASGRQLVAYAVPTSPELADTLAERIKAQLAERLPDYMVPARIMALQALPRLVSGKLDRAALPEPSAEAVKAFVAPRNELEQRLADIWTQVLGCERVGITDNFFELGGDSILSLQVISRVRTARLGFELRLRDLLRHQTIEALLASRQGVPSTGGTPAAPGVLAEGAVPLIPIQSWFFEQPIPERHHFNQAAMLIASQPLDHERLRLATDVLGRRHDALRMRFEPQANGQWAQRYETGESGRILWLEDVKDAADIEALAERAQRSLDLAQGPLWRVVHMRHADGSARLLIVIHHLVVDGVSWRILLADLQEVYSLGESGVAGLPAGTASYKAWAEHLQTWARSPELAAQLPYWQAQLTSATEPPRDDATVPALLKDRTVVQLKASQELTQLLLRGASAAYRTGIDDLLLAALSRATAAWTGHGDVLINMEGHGREGDAANLDLSHTTGWFTSVYPVRLKGGDMPLGPSIEAVAGTLRAVPDKGVGYGALRYLHPDETVRTLLDSVRPRITFNYLGQFDQTFKEDSPFGPAMESAGAHKSIDGPMANWIEILGQVYDGVLTMTWIFSSAMYRSSTIENLAAAYQGELEAIVRHCVAVKASAS